MKQPVSIPSIRQKRLWWATTTTTTTTSYPHLAHQLMLTELMLAEGDHSLSQWDRSPSQG